MKSAVTLGVLLLLLAAAVAWAVWAWVLGDVEGGRDISVHGFVAMAIGTVGTLAIGGGLMFLVFYSNRHGYDDAAGDWERRRRPRDARDARND